MTNIGLRTKSGFRMTDRTFMIYCPKTNSMVSAKTIPRLTCLRAEIVGHHKLEMRLSDDYRSIILDPKGEGKLQHLYKNVDICSKPADAFDCGDEAAQWITEWLHKTSTSTSTENSDEKKEETTDYRILFFDVEDPDESCLRDVREVMASRQAKIGRKLPENLDYKTTFTDVAAYYMHSEESEKFVSEQVKNQGFPEVDPDAFRSNLVIRCDNGQPFDEDRYEKIYIGRGNQKYVLNKYARCPRCVLTTVDIGSGQPREDNQPIRWLNRNRRIPENEVAAYNGGVQCHLGNYYAVDLENSGKTCAIKVGDEVYGVLKAD